MTSLFVSTGKCIASQVNATFFSISASSLTSKWVSMLSAFSQPLPSHNLPFLYALMSIPLEQFLPFLIFFSLSFLAPPHSATDRGGGEDGASSVCRGKMPPTCRHLHG